MEELIQAVKEEPILYNMNHVDYLKFYVKKCVWDTISRKLNYVDGDHARKLWFKLRHCHRDYLRRKSFKERNGICTSFKPWKYEKQMEFLIKYYTTYRKSFSNDDQSSNSESMFSEISTSNDFQCLNNASSITEIRTFRDFQSSNNESLITEIRTLGDFQCSNNETLITKKSTLNVFQCSNNESLKTEKSTFNDFQCLNNESMLTEISTSSDFDDNIKTEAFDSDDSKYLTTESYTIEDEDYNTIAKAFEISKEKKIKPKPVDAISIEDDSLDKSIELLNKPEEQEKEREVKDSAPNDDELYHFYTSMYKITKSLALARQIKIKRIIFNAVAEEQEQELLNSGNALTR